MRKTLAIFGMFLAVGCQAQRESSANAPRDRVFAPGAAALVYTPPMAVGENELDMSREGRGLYAMGGVETTIIDTTYVYQDDRQRYDKWGDWSRFERRAVSTSVTVRQR